MTKDDLALAPRATRTVVGLDLGRVRASGLWRRINELLADAAKFQKTYGELRSQCADPGGLDGPRSVLVALPDLTGSSKDAALVVRLATPIDDAKLHGCVDFLTSPQQHAVGLDYRGKKIWVSSKEGGENGFGFALFDERTVVLGTTAWIRQAIDAAAERTAPSARQNADLVALLKRAKPAVAIWGAGEVPDAMREALSGNPKTELLKSLRAVVGSLDLTVGLVLELKLDTASAADASAVVASVTAQLAELKGSPQMALLGVTPLLEGVKVRANGATFEVMISLTAAQLDDLITRGLALVRGFAGAATPATPPSEGD